MGAIVAPTIRLDSRDFMDQPINVSNEEQRFFTLGCVKCGGFQLGKMNNGPDALPIFPSRLLAEMAVGDFVDPEEAEEHPQFVMEIGVRIIPPTL